LSAEQFLTAGDVGIMPWVPLMKVDGPPETVLERGAARIEREAPPKDQTDLLVVSQVLAGLRYPGLDLSAFFGGQKAMLESPVIEKWRAEACHELILDALKDRFGSTPRDITKQLRAIVKEKTLRRLSRIANKCADLDAFRQALLEEV
jgi:hypothetical protein